MMISAVFIPIVFSVLFIGLMIKGLYRCDQETYGALDTPFVFLWLVPLACTWVVWFAVT